MFWKRRKTAPPPPPPAPGDPELESLRAAAAERRERAAALQLEVLELENFGAEVEARLGPLQRRLEELRASEAEARFRRWSGRQPPPPPNPWIGRAPQEAEPLPPAPAAPAPLDDAQIKSLYRSLAKRFHPDLAGDPGHKPWREQIMAQVNQAYAERDLEALQALVQQPDHPPAGEKSRSDQLAELRAEIERLDGMIAELQGSLDRWADSPAVQFKLDISLARGQGRDLLTELEADLRAEIAQLEESLAGL